MTEIIDLPSTAMIQIVVDASDKYERPASRPYGGKRRYKWEATLDVNGAEYQAYNEARRLVRSYEIMLREQYAKARYLDKVASDV